MNRREFLQSTSLSAAVFGVSALTARGAPGANDRLQLGLIGVGSRGLDLLREILRLAEKHNVTITALCDVWRKNLQAAGAAVREHLGHEPRQFTRFADVLALREVDAVVIATPDFSHAPILIAALEAGKDAYVEKPMAIDIPSANKALDLARANNRVVQAGTQYRSDGRYLGAKKLLATGLLGHISRISIAVNFNEPRWARRFDDCTEADVDWEAFLMHLPKRSFDARLLRRWHHFREFTNGLPGLWMTHYADLVSHLTGATYPVSAVAHGGIYVWNDGREHTDTFHALLDYREGFLFSWAMGLANSAGTHFSLYGTKGTMDLQNWTVSNAGSPDPHIETQPLTPERGESHMENWLACLRTRQRPNADIQFGHQHVVATVMAAAALETGRRQKYDPDKRLMSAG